MEGNVRRAGIVLFHDHDGRVDSYFLRVLESLRPWCDHLLVVVNGIVDDHGRRLLWGCVDDVLVRPNEGWDVGGYRAGLEHLGWSSLGAYDELLLTNNTYFAPLRPWGPVFEDAAQHPEATLWGLTEHAQVTPHPFLAERVMPRHLQSYFLVVRRRLLTDPVFRHYWDTMPPIRSYRDSVGYHEARFTQYVEQHGHMYHAVYPLEAFAKGRGQLHDPALHAPDQLLDMGCPILKRRILFHDPLNLDEHGVDVPALLDAAAEAGIEEDELLEAVARTCSPRVLVVNAGLTACAEPEAARAERGAAPIMAHALVVSATQMPSVLEGLSRSRSLTRVVLCCADRSVRDETERILANHPLHGVDVDTRLATFPAAGRLVSLLVDAGDLLSGDALVARLPVVGAVQAQVRVDADLLAVMLDASASLATRHPALGMVVRAVRVRGTLSEPTGWPAGETGSRLADAVGLCGGLSSGTPPPWMPGEFVAVRPAVYEGWDVDGVRDLVCADPSCEGTLERVEVLAVAERGRHVRQLVTAKDLRRDFAALEQRYYSLSALLPGGPEEQYRHLAARFGGEASIGGVLRRELEHRAPHLANVLTPLYRRVRAGLGPWRGRRGHWRSGTC